MNFLKTILKRFTRDITHIREDEIKDIVMLSIVWKQIINGKKIKEQG